MEEFGASVTLTQPMDPRAVPGYGALQRSKPEKLPLQKSTKSTLLHGERSNLHSHIQPEYEFIGNENL
jgi:hypothetical protein